MNTRVNSIHLDDKILKWQIEAEGCFGLWFPMGRDALFDTKEEAEEFRQRFDKYYAEQSEQMAKLNESNKDMNTSKITLALVRSFAIGFEIHSPKLNGFSVEFNFACFTLQLWSRGKKWFNLKNYWNG